MRFAVSITHAVDVDDSEVEDIVGSADDGSQAWYKDALVQVREAIESDVDLYTLGTEPEVLVLGDDR